MKSPIWRSPIWSSTGRSSTGRRIAGIIPLLAVAAVLAFSFAPRHSAHADGASCTAVLAGMESGKKTPVEILVMNLSPGTATLDLLVRGPDGAVLLDQAGSVVVTARGTRSVSISDLLAEGVRPKDVYKGLVSVELTGDAPFGDEFFIVHATQYFGKRKNPKGAVVFRALFLTDE